MFKRYQLNWFFMLTISLTLASLLLRKEPFTGIKYYHILYFILSVHLGVASSWMSLGYILTKNFDFKYPILKYFLSIAVAIVCSMAMVAINYYILPGSPLDGKTVGLDTLENILLNFSGVLLIVLICFVVFYSAHTTTILQNTKLEKERLEQAHLRAQLVSLQQQISPHFLFNSLSTLRTMVADKTARNYIVELSSVYRYVLRYNEDYLTSLSEELNFIKSYLYILNERFEDSLIVKIAIKEENLALKLPPMSLQLLVENAIKHNTSSPEQPLEISIFNRDYESITIENNFRPKKNFTRWFRNGAS